MTSPKQILSPEVYYNAIEGSDSGLWVLDIATSVCFLSNRYYTMLGYEPQEFEGSMEFLMTLLHPDDVAKTTAIFNDFFQNKIPKYRNEVRLKMKSGDYLDILTQGIAERNDAGEMIKFIGWNIDISPLKNAQRKLDEERTFNISQSSFAQIGLLAGGISHEVNNPLMVVQLWSEILLRDLRQTGPIDPVTHKKALDNILEAVRRIGVITKGLNIIAGRAEEKQRSTISLKLLTEEVLRIYQSTLKDKISLKLEMTEAKANIFGNGALISQVIMNVMKNALDAVQEVKEKRITVRIWEDEKFVNLSIQDNGPGIKDQDKAKVMLPFFTTKSPGKGTGLGLSIAQSIVHSQDGEITFTSSPGDTTFSIRFLL